MQKKIKGLPDRLFAVAWLIVCAIILYKIWELKVPFVYEPMGPRPFPLILSGLMAICCVVLLAVPDLDIHWPENTRIVKPILLIGILLGYASLFEILGFPLASLLMVILVSRLYGGSWRKAWLSGFAVGVLGYLFFDRVLQVTLPLGILQYG